MCLTNVFKSITIQLLYGKSVYKESVELTFVYLSEGCGKTYVRINDAIPHT